MYIDKWWGNVTCGDTDDAMVLVDYFQNKNKKTYAMAEIIKDAHLDRIWGIRPLHETPEINCHFIVGPEEQGIHMSIDIPINLIIDLSALLLQSFVEGSVTLEEPDLDFSLSANQQEVRMLITELERAVQEPHLYYPDFLQDAFTEMKDGIIEICNELKNYS